MQHILSICRNCYLSKNNEVIEREIASKIKWVFADIICNDTESELMKNNVNYANDSLPTDTFIEPRINL